MITTSEIDAVWSVVGKVSIFIATLVALVQGFKYLVSLMPTSKLEQRIASCEEHNKNDFEHLKDIDVRVGALERRLTETNKEIEYISESIKRIGLSQISLLRHFVNGNGQKEMESEADDLTEFFVGQKWED